VSQGKERGGVLESGSGHLADRHEKTEREAVEIHVSYFLYWREERGRHGSCRIWRPGRVRKEEKSREHSPFGNGEKEKKKGEK